MRWVRRLLKGKRVHGYGESFTARVAHKGGAFDLDEVFMDASNLPLLDPAQMEGRVTTPVARTAIFAIGALALLVGTAFAARAYDLQVMRGDQFAAISANNRLANSIVFAQRGVVYDRTGTELAWNEPGDAAYAERIYANQSGLAHLVGYVQYPRQDSAGVWWRTELSGVSGIEQLLDTRLAGENGLKIIEVDAVGDVQREHITRPALDGENVTLSIDAAVQSKLFSVLSQHAAAHGFRAGAAAIMDVETGELLALTSFPEYDQRALTDGDAEVLAATAANDRSPFLFRAVAGTYTPGSIVKPFFAAAALAEGIISPLKSIYSSGQLVVPNPYDPEKPSIFRDWRAHGWTDMREAIAVSSDVYFYTIGGGFEEQRGLGIDRLDEYARYFGFGNETGSIFPDEAAGVIPTPAWKEATFDGDPWRLGDTYITAIGQYGFQVTPLQAVRATAALANGGTMLTPLIRMNQSVGETSRVPVAAADLAVTREGMRLAVTADNGTARSINVPGMSLAGKTGTAELGTQNQWMNSWVIGFWPYDNPKYAFAAVLERAPAGTLSGAAPAMRGFFDWLVAEQPVYARPHE